MADKPSRPGQQADAYCLSVLAGEEVFMGSEALFRVSLQIFEEEPWKKRLQEVRPCIYLSVGRSIYVSNVDL